MVNFGLLLFFECFVLRCVIIGIMVFCVDLSWLCEYLVVRRFGCEFEVVNMSIRKRMLLLMFFVGLLPLVVVSGLYVVSARVVSDKIVVEVEASEQLKFEREIRSLMVKYVFSRETKQGVIEVSLAAQVRELEELFGRSGDVTRGWKSALASKFKRMIWDGVKMDRFSLSFAALYKEKLPVDSDAGDLKKIFLREATIDGKEMVLFRWDDRVGAGVEGLDRIKMGGADGRGHFVDFGSRKVLRYYMPIKIGDGTVVGVTGFDMPVSEEFGKLHLRKRWQEDAVGLLLELEGDHLKVFSKKVFGKSYDFDNGVVVDTVGKELEKVSEVLIEEMKTWFDRGYRFKVVEGVYDGRDCYWVSITTQVAGKVAVIVVPKRNVLVEVDKAVEGIVRQNTVMLRYVLMVVVGLILLVVVVGLLMGRRMTKPIGELVRGVNLISGGDFGTHVDIKSGDEFEVLANAVNEMGVSLRKGEKMRQSLEVASLIQSRLLPSGPPSLDGFDIAGICAYCDETGGDYYDYLALDNVGEGLCGVVLGDLTGHGIGAAMLMATARCHFRHYARREGRDLGKVFEAFNDALYLDTEDDKFMTMFYGVIDSEAKRMNWVSGGHDPAQVLAAGSDAVVELEGNGMLLGVVDGIDYEEGEAYVFEVGDIVVVGTDGIWEARNEGDVMYGKERWRGVILANREKDAMGIGQAIVDDVMAFCGSAKRLDDITAVVIKRV